MRIRTIKPEFWVSESMGRLSRDERLVFVGLWSVADDHGRFRADPRYLAGQLFPYDVDGVETVSRGLASLREEGCVELYGADRSRYGVVTGWKSHQKIDKPSNSRLPAPEDGQPLDSIEFVDSSRTLANSREPSATPREVSCEDQGSGKGREQGEEQGAGSAPSAVELTPTELHQRLEPPTAEPADWSREDFWRWAQCKRREGGLLIEKWPPPRTLRDFWTQARAVTSTEALQEAFYKFGDDKHWQKATPPLPFNAFASQWAKYLPAGGANASA